MKRHGVMLATMFLTLWATWVPPCWAGDLKLDWIHASKDGSYFVRSQSTDKFIAWGFNYDHDASGRLLEDYWSGEWPTVVGDFNEMKSLGANVVRIHLQTAKFMQGPREPNDAALGQLALLVKLAEQTGLYLDITGLACYHKKEVPQWYDAMSEAERWDVQAVFWQAVARTSASSNAVFCYDLMNEPIVPAAGKKETEWLTGEFGGSTFVQRITLDLAGRTSEQVAKAWVDKLVKAIRVQDDRHMVTVGVFPRMVMVDVIPWILKSAKAKPLFYSKQVSENLDFTSIHLYPKSSQVNKALADLAAYDIGKPLVVEEMFPLSCSLDDLDTFINRSRKITDGYFGFYWGKTIEQYDREKGDIAGAITSSWLKYFRTKGRDILGSPRPKDAIQKGR